MQICVYTRVSTRDKNQDTENQAQQLRAFAAKQGWTIVKEYTDRVTGKHTDREQFQQMFEAASKRKFDLVLFWSLDRLTREGALATLQHLQRLLSYGVGFRSYTEQYLDSCGLFRDAIIGILATLAQQERVRLSERVVAGLQRARKAGRTGGRPRVDVDYARVRALRDSGVSFGQIATQMGISKPLAFRICQQNQ